MDRIAPLDEVMADPGVDRDDLTDEEARAYVDDIFGYGDNVVAQFNPFHGDHGHFSSGGGGGGKAPRTITSFRSQIAGHVVAREYHLRMANRVASREKPDVHMRIARRDVQGATEAERRTLMARERWHANREENEYWREHGPATFAWTAGSALHHGQKATKGFDAVESHLRAADYHQTMVTALRTRRIAR